MENKVEDKCLREDTDNELSMADSESVTESGYKKQTDEDVRCMIPEAHKNKRKNSRTSH